MNTLAIRLLLTFSLVLAVAAGSYWAGDRNRNNAWIAKQAKAAKVSIERFDAEVVRGSDATQAYELAKRDSENRYSDLERKFNAVRTRVPLIASCNATADTQAGALGTSDPVYPSDRSAADRATGVRDAVGPDPVLSYGAVWMWNSSLIGADLSTDTCGAADTSNTSCAASSGLTVLDAWENHDTNAQSCAADRLRYQHLIDFLKGRAP